MNDTFTCADCHQTKPVQKNGGTGYAIFSPENPIKVCYACCGLRDKQTMIETGKIVLYWNGKRITNWPGTLAFNPTRHTSGRHNIGRTRENVWFTGPDNKPWYGVNIGDNDILRCKRIK